MDVGHFNDELPNFMPNKNLPKFSKEISNILKIAKRSQIDREYDDEEIKLPKEEKKPTEIGIIYEEISLLDSFHEEKVIAKNEFDFPPLFQDKFQFPTLDSLNVINVFNNINVRAKTIEELSSSTMNLLINLNEVKTMKDVNYLKDSEKKMKKDQQNLTRNSGIYIQNLKQLKQKLEDSKASEVYPLHFKKTQVLNISNAKRNNSQKSFFKNSKNSQNPKNPKNLGKHFKNIKALINSYTKNKFYKLPLINTKSNNSNISIKLLTSFNKLCTNTRNQEENLVSGAISTNRIENLTLFTTFTQLEDDNSLKHQQSDLISHFRLSKNLENNYVENENI